MTTQLHPVVLALETECGDCPSEDDRKDMRGVLEAWIAAEFDVYEAYVQTHQFALWDEFLRSPEHGKFVAENYRPEDVPDVGCAECNWTGLVLTPLGRQLITLVNRYAAGGVA